MTNPSRPLFQARHYEAIAKCVAGHEHSLLVWRDNLEGIGCGFLIGDIPYALAALFGADNPKFDTVRFLKACTEENSNG